LAGGDAGCGREGPVAAAKTARFRQAERRISQWTIVVHSVIMCQYSIVAGALGLMQPKLWGLKCESTLQKSIVVFS
jgi:hypothetical protein